MLVKFPADESGKMRRKLSRPWHGPYRVIKINKPDVTIEKIYMYRSQDGSIQIHTSRVTPCPDEFPAGYFWYGSHRHSPGHPPQLVDRLEEERTPDKRPSESEKLNQSESARSPPSRERRCSTTNPYALRSRST